MAKNDFRVTSIFKIIIRICMKNVEFCRKTSKFLPKRCLFIFCIFYLHEKELNQQVCLIKYVQNEISDSTSQKKIKKIKKNKERERERERSKNKTPEKFSLVKLLIHCHKLSLLPLLVRRWRKFEKQKLMLNFESCY